jgi:glutathione S-transferase
VLRATVPVLREGPLVITDSTDIARHAERHGSGTPLFPAGRDDDVHHWIGVADAAAAGGRALVTAGLLASPGALDETLPPQVPLWVRPLLRPVTRHGTRWFARKYTLDLNNRAGALDVMRRGLDALRVALPTADSMLLGTFSYADIAVTTVLQGIKPVEHARYPLAPHTRAVWTVPELVAEYPDLLAWRDALYQRHR